MRKFLLILSILFTSTSQADEKFLMQPSDYAEIIKGEDVQLVDVRTAKEFSEGTIGKASNMDVLSNDFSKKIRMLDKTKPVYVFCRSGKRSQKAREILLKDGFETVYDLQGGYNAWQKWKAQSE